MDKKLKERIKQWKEDKRTVETEGGSFLIEILEEAGAIIGELQKGSDNN